MQGKISWGIAIVVLAVVLLGDFTTGTKAAVVIGAFLLHLISQQDKRFRRVENAVGILDDATNKEAANKSISYRADIILEPNWQKIINDLAKDGGVEPERFVKEIYADKKLNVKEGEGVFGKLFRFVYFSDGISGMTQIWSDRHKTFVDKMEIRERLFSSEEGMNFAWIGHDKYGENRVGTSIVIAPHVIGFPEVLPDGDFLDEEKLGEVPFWTIIQFLTNLDKYVGIWGSMYMIKTFPKELSDLFEKHEIKYDPWNFEDYGCGGGAKKKLVEKDWTKQNGVEIYDQKMREQTFQSPYLTVRIRIEAFNL